MLARACWVCFVGGVAFLVYSDIRFRQARAAWDRIMAPVENLTTDEFTEQAYSELGMG